MYKIAFASSDGKMVNQHFGRTKKFLIFRISDNSAEFIELRENNPACNGFEHTDEVLYKSVELVSDCKEIYVSRIGYGALKALQDKKIKVYEAPYFISDIISTIIAVK